MAETAASLKGAQRELGDVRRAAEAATLEAERAHAQVHEMQLQTEQLQATVVRSRRGGASCRPS